MIRAVRGRLSLFLVLACSLALVAGAGARSVVAGGWQNHRVAAAGFSLATPDTWVDFTRMTPTVLALVRKNPALRPYVELVSTSKTVKLILVDVSTTALAAGFSSNVNVVETPAGGADLRLIRDVTLVQLKQSGLLRSRVSTGTLELPAGRALELRYEVNSSGRLFAATQFILIRGNVAYVLSYATTPALEPRYESTFLRSARSFRFM